MPGTVNIADCATNEARCVGQEQVLCQGAFTIGVGGAVSASSTDDPALTLADDSGVGVHALTFPRCPYARIVVSLKSAALTVCEYAIVAKDAGAGTASITLAKAGAAAQAANGDIVNVRVMGKLV